MTFLCGEIKVFGGMIDFLYAIDPKDVARVIYPTVYMRLHPVASPSKYNEKKKSDPEHPDEL
jgi:hypothetical protein